MPNSKVHCEEESTGRKQMAMAIKGNENEIMEPAMHFRVGLWTSHKSFLIVARGPYKNYDDSWWGGV